MLNQSIRLTEENTQVTHLSLTDLLSICSTLIVAGRIANNQAPDERSAVLRAKDIVHEVRIQAGLEPQDEFLQDPRQDADVAESDAIEHKLGPDGPAGKE